MKLSVILILLLFSTASQAVHLSSNGMGQVLIFPYYTINNDINTLMNFVNTTDQAKALRVRFREAANSKEVYAFNLYLGPHDVWTGGLVASGQVDGDGTKIISADESCTVPSIGFSGGLFTKDKYTGSLSDAYGSSFDRLREGFIEVIEMGVMTGDSATATLMNDDQPQANCALLQNAWDASSSDAYWLVDSNTDMLPPSGGIIGNIIILDVAGGIAVTEEPTVLSNFSDSILHFAVDDPSPNLADGITMAQVEDLGSITDINWETGFQAVSSLLMKDSISNEYILADSIGANTEWMLTLPTRQFHLDIQAQGNSDHLAPFTVADSSTISCEPFSVSEFFDRESQTEPMNIILPPERPPGLPGPFSLGLCFASSYMNFNRSDDVSGDGIILGGHYPVGSTSNGDPVFPRNSGFKPNYQEGWVELGFDSDNNQAMSINGTSIIGLPMIGFSVQRYVNANLSGGILANYAGIFNHKSAKTIVKSENHPAKFGMSTSQGKIGQVLLFPYYTVKNGINTLISVVNTTDEVKAVKIRFNEGTNGRDTLDFNLYLSPYDVWTAGLVIAQSTFDEGHDTAKIITHDTSCTVPAISGQEFLPFAFTGLFDDGQGANIDRALEGSFEIIEMGTVVGSDAESATHTSVGVPSSCGSINGNWRPGSGKWSMDPTINLVPPDGTGGLYGSVSLIDVSDGVDMSYDATTIVGYSTIVQHIEPGALIPNLSTGNQAATLIETKEGVISTTWDSPIDAVSALFMYSQVVNDFVITTSIGAQTEWVNTFPTKPFYVDPFIATRPVPVTPFNIALSSNMGACENHRFKAFDRNQQLNTAFNTPIFPLLPPGIRFYPEDCWSVVVSDVNNGVDDNTIFASSLNIGNPNIDPDYSDVNDLQFTSGWMQIDFVDEVINPGKLVGVGPNGEMHEIFGKPVLGFVAQKYVNNNLSGGVLANYATINQNKGKRKIVITSANKNPVKLGMRK